MKALWALAPLSFAAPLLYFFLVAPVTLSWAFPGMDVGLQKASYRSAEVSLAIPARATVAEEMRRSDPHPPKTPSSTDTPFTRYANASAARGYMAGGASVLVVMAILATLAAGYSLYLSLFSSLRLRRRSAILTAFAVVLCCYALGAPLSISKDTMQRNGAPVWLQQASNDTEDASDHIRNVLLNQIVVPAEGEILSRGTMRGISALLEMITYFGFSATLAIFAAFALLAAPLRTHHHEAEIYRAQLNEFVWLAVLSAGILVSGVYTQLQLFRTIVSLAPVSIRSSLDDLSVSLVTLWAANATIALLLSSLPALISWAAGTYRLAIVENPRCSAEERQGWMKARGIDFSLRRIVALLLSVLAPLVTGPILHALAGGLG